LVVIATNMSRFVTLCYAYSVTAETQSLTVFEGPCYACYAFF
jgi:hypothetical protein